MPELLAAIRPDGQSFALLLHLVGATVVFGALLASATSLALARGETRLLRLGYFSLLLVGLPGLILLRLAGEWLYRQQGWNELPDEIDEPAWLDIGFVVADLGGLLFLLALALGGIGVYRLRRGKGGAGLLKATMVIALVLVLAYVVAVWAMTGKPVESILGTSAGAADGETQLTIQVTGRQWFWDVEYPDEGVRTANELHLPVGVPVRVEVTSEDVIHSFWVPRLDRNLAMIPGQTNVLTLEANEEGAYRGQCAEYCGVQHAGMGFWVVAESADRFDAWLAAQRRPAAEPDSEREVAGRQVLLGSACVYCHRIADTNATGKVGPDLTHLASRRSLAAGLYPNSRAWLAGWILDPQHLKPGNKMPATDLTGEELQWLLDYLESLR